MKDVSRQRRFWEDFVVRGGVELCALLTLIGAAGCPSVIGPLPDPGGEIVDCNRDTTATGPVGNTSGVPNDEFTDSIVAVFEGEDVARLQGTVETIGDLDVYQLGALSRGDRITMNAYTPNSSLDVTIAMFDPQGRLVANNDDRRDQGAQARDAYIDFIVRHPGNPYYLVVTHSPFAETSLELVGSYRVDIDVDSGFDVPQPAGQTLLLDFDGGIVDFPALGLLGPIRLGPFDAADISAVYENDTETIKNRIREVFEQNYERFNVAILTTDDPPPPAGTVYSTISFGGFSRSTFGIAEDVDLYNEDCCDDAIIFTESFTPSVFFGVPSAREVGTAIGNVGSHEAGHVLGLNHTDNDCDLMDDQSPAEVFLQNQEFMESPLSNDIMPIGTQDGVLLLNESVGPREAN